MTAPRSFGVVFDFDGVIADTERLHLRAYQQVLGPLGITLDETTYYARYLGFDDVGVFAAVASDTERRWTAREVGALLEQKSLAFDALVRTVDVVFPSAVRCIDRLAAAGVPMAIASGALAVEIEAILDGAALRRHFSAIVAAGGTVRSKPAPDPYARAVELLEAARPTGGDSLRICVAIEDSQWGLDSARAAGLRTVAVTTTYPASALSGADLVIDDLDEVSAERLQALCTPSR